MLSARCSLVPTGGDGMGRRTAESHAFAGLSDADRETFDFPRQAAHKVRPGRFEFPRSKRTTRPSTLRATCASFPVAIETPTTSGIVDDLDLVDSAFVVVMVSRA